MNSVHLVTREKYRVKPGQNLSQVHQNTQPGLAEHTRRAQAAQPAAPRAPACACRASMPFPRALCPCRPACRAPACTPVPAASLLPLAQHARALSALRPARSPAARAPSAHACCHAQPSAQPSAVSRHRPSPGSQYSLYCNTNLLPIQPQYSAVYCNTLLPNQLYCNTVLNPCTPLYCNTHEPLAIQFQPLQAA